jgi:hypothetical protein|tara:strand:+ start:400 stop:621 length:222 start_codon:yes stop_codon:yes gene_type:complete
MGLTFIFGLSGGSFCSLLDDTVGLSGVGLPTPDTTGGTSTGLADTAGVAFGLLLAGDNLVCLLCGADCIGSIL